MEVQKAKFKELAGLHAIGCFERPLRNKSVNRVDTRCIITWRWVDGVPIIKFQLTMRGFKGKAEDLQFFAGTATRNGQRVVNAVAAQRPDWDPLPSMFHRPWRGESPLRGTGGQHALNSEP